MGQYLLSLFMLLMSFGSTAQHASFRFAFVTDTHIGSPNGSPEEDLRRTVRDINLQTDLAFVLVTGDITEMGTDAEIRLAKSILDSLDIPWYPIPGNHDTGWSESGGQSFIRLFGSDKFHFVYQGVHFIGCASGPYVRMSDGHMPRDAINWLDKELSSIATNEPIFFVNHYPIDSSLDNWYEATDRLRARNTLVAICGHGHANKRFDFEGIPGVMGRSNLRAKAPGGGYNWVEVRSDSLFFSERKPLEQTTRLWASVKTGVQKSNGSYPRPDFSINRRFNEVQTEWTVHSSANILASPTLADKLVVVGNHIGELNAYQANSGKWKWTYRTSGAIYSTAAIAQDRVVIGSADGGIHGVDLKTGKGIWKIQTPASVLGSALIQEDTVFIGGSAGDIYALRLSDGSRIWTYSGLEGPVVSTPVIAQGKLILGAWDRHLYAIDTRTGELRWKWNNGSSVRNFSPASCTPVIRDSLVYIVAPDRFVSAIHLTNGNTIWRTKEGGLRESIGISADGQWLYGKSMQDTLVAFPTSAELPKASWKMPVGYGYDHVPSMLIEEEGTLFFGTRNGVVYAVDPQSQRTIWAHKVDNAMVNTIRVINRREMLVSTMDGRLVKLSYRGAF